MPDFIKKVSDSLSLIHIHATPEQIELFAAYLLLLKKWNKAYNLTAVRDLHEMLERHLLDSLSIAPFLSGKRFIDVGTGAGLPGIPLAILNPQNHYTLLDSNGKKTRFLEQVKLQLKLDNVTVVNTRVENLQVEEKFDGVLSRAFASLDDMLQGSDHLCKKDGHFFAMKGLVPETQLQAINKPYKVLPITWPGNDSERHLIIISQV